NAQDAREFSNPLVRDAIASVFIAADLPRRYVGGLGKLAHCHPAMLTVFLQALSDVCVDGALAIHGDHPCSLAPVLYPEGPVCQAYLIRSRPLFALSLGVAPLDPTVNFAEIVRLSVATEHHHRDYRYTCWSHYQNDVRLAAANPFRCQADRSPTLNRCLAGNQRSRRSTRRSPLGSFLAQRDS